MIWSSTYGKGVLFGVALALATSVYMVNRDPIYVRVKKDLEAKKSH
eukprot:CAMPEP_0175041824 /NCGR_PEP_ID=MMETSP0052_2-20121109/2162_1 /TAXON_ID=51329 ORGANISM="Polytomella parva, Strain SAG 63-3" /NCGR_SAMPLE_ID=MMETSP0052_2 /ASSEMBLY_ACC=CAM_ASM_000194 /LENGTH=45 /DNA_ID= /DNA_START= /DNA_END= /DNA_ORIENTATION=